MSKRKVEESIEFQLESEHEAEDDNQHVNNSDEDEINTSQLSSRYDKDDASIVGDVGTFEETVNESLFSPTQETFEETVNDSLFSPTQEAFEETVNESLFSPPMDDDADGNLAQSQVISRRLNKTHFLITAFILFHEFSFTQRGNRF